jgi:hypothetical protein
MKKAPRNMNRSPRIKKLHETLLEQHRALVTTMHNQEDLIDDIRLAVPQIDPLMDLYDEDRYAQSLAKPHIRIVNDPSWRDIDIYTNLIPYDQVIEHIAGPIHRLVDTDWEANVHETGNITLTGSTTTPNTEWNTTNIKIHVSKGIPACQVVTRVIGTRIVEDKESKIICS